MKYKCLKCGFEFEVKNEVTCPDCGAHDWDCEPLYHYKHSHVEVQVPEQVAGE